MKSGKFGQGAAAIATAAGSGGRVHESGARSAAQGVPSAQGQDAGQGGGRTDAQARANAAVAAPTPRPTAALPKGEALGGPARDARPENGGQEDAISERPAPGGADAASFPTGAPDAAPAAAPTAPAAADAADAAYRCSETVVHREAVARALAALPPQRDMEEAAALFKVLGDATRMRILLALAREELCVCDLGELLDMTQSAISHQLRVLRAARIVRSRRDGKMVFYALDDAHIERLVAAALDHVRE